jgi:glycosyltransferase involved in cell wall biosynthesis
MRVLHVLTALGHGGAETWLLNLIEPLKKRGVELGFQLKAPEFGTREQMARDAGCSIYHVRIGWPPWVYVREMADIVRRERYDIIHTHEFVHGAAPVIAAKLAGVPSVVTFHHWMFEAQTEFTRRVGVKQARRLYGELSFRYAKNHANAVTTLSNAVMRRIDPALAHDPRFHRLRLSVDIPPELDSVARAQVRAELGLDPSARLVVHIGRFIEQKNHFGVLDVFDKVHARVPAARLVLCGVGPLRDAVLERAKRLPCADAVVYAGLRNDVPRLLAASDVLLFPSRDEGFGLVALEANAAGIPVVGSRVDGLDEAVEEGKTALLFPLHDVEGMSAAVVRVLEDPALCRGLGDAGRSRAATDYSHERSASELLEVYESVRSKAGR